MNIKYHDSFEIIVRKCISKKETESDFNINS
jgi:hypothetical protein